MNIGSETTESVVRHAAPRAAANAEMLAAVATVCVHVLLLVMALALRLHDARLAPVEVSVTFEGGNLAPAPRDATHGRSRTQERTTSQGRTRTHAQGPTHAQGRTHAALSSPALPIVTTAAGGEAPVLFPVGTDSTAACSDTDVPSMERVAKMSPGEAIAELGRLLEKHPEFRKSILREMMAGDGAVQPRAPLVIPGLERIIREFGAPNIYGGPMRGLGGMAAVPVYSPVHGLNTNPYGASFNYLGLLMKLVSWLKNQ